MKEGLDISEQPGNQLPASITSTLVSSTAYKFGKPTSSPLTRSVSPTILPGAYTDFYGTPSGAPCIFKTGLSCLNARVQKRKPYIREVRAVHGHPITGCWLKIGEDIKEFLNSRSVEWTSVDPVGFANAGEETPFCPLVAWIGVLPKTLPFRDAMAAAEPSRLPRD
jgi:hypothetical protein